MLGVGNRGTVLECNMGVMAKSEEDRKSGKAGKAGKAVVTSTSGDAV